MDEKEQIKKVLNGNISAFSYFVEEYQDMAVTIAYRFSRNMQDAEDIVQESFIKAYRNLHAFRTESKFSTWFYRIVCNTAISQMQSVEMNVEYEDYKTGDIKPDDYGNDIFQKLYEEQQYNLINEALEKMPVDEALTLTLYYLEEKSVKEIVFITEMTESNVKIKLHRGRKRLADILYKLDGFDEFKEK